ncbi:glycosyl hydrolase family 28-related protein [Metabacillus arenae]|uniref:Rhamnogalacturonase A/B/Epimerase-like pectate lyase domain-containing protein n=1 Tax=Metabacillus arenae TaxID=2771434 RepID=A0A926NN39_9BACI|nr:glycosyl hydrolase family 28-related protein [Metabacillus arenae]MBD1381027.1 hypothetical protein [Metabacillus arenae]
MVKRIIFSFFVIVASFYIFPTLLTDETIVINVKNYGAKGDGVSDDTAAIQSALKDGADNKIYFPEGEYKISKELHISDNTEVYGSNAKINASADLITVMRVKGSNIIIRNLTVNGKKTALRGITIEESSSRVVISENVIQNFTQPEARSLSRLTVSAIRVKGGTKNIIMDQNYIENVMARNPVKGWGHYVARGILIRPDSSNQPAPKNITISNSSITNIGPKDDGDGIVVQGFKDKINLKILNNSFSYTYKRAIKIQSPGVLIKGNKIYNNFYQNNFYTTYPNNNLHDMWSAISIYADHSTIVDNTITGVGHYGRIIDVANASHIKIIKNHLKNGHKGTDKNTSIIAITSNHSNDVLKDYTILDNTLINAKYGIYTNSDITDLNVWNNKQVNINKNF